VLTIVDTPGAEMSVAAEEGGLSFAIADCLATLLAAPFPTLAVLAGEGGSGGAIALLAADRVVCAEHASLEAIAPEGHRRSSTARPTRAAELAATQGGASWDLARFGIADVVVPEHPADRSRRSPSASAPSSRPSCGH
jgi:acetyl-CoA carboxylase carboxyl transferase subunit beta